MATGVTRKLRKRDDETQQKVKFLYSLFMLTFLPSTSVIAVQPDIPKRLMKDPNAKVLVAIVQDSCRVSLKMLINPGETIPQAIASVKGEIARGVNYLDCGFGSAPVRCSAAAVLQALCCWQNSEKKKTKHVQDRTIAMVEVTYYTTFRVGEFHGANGRLLPGMTEVQVRSVRQTVVFPLVCAKKLVKGEEVILQATKKANHDVDHSTNAILGAAYYPELV